MNQSAGLEARIGVTFTLECKDDAGNVLKTIPICGALAFPLIEQPEPESPDGLDRSE